MKALLLICLLVAAPFVWSGNGPPGSMVKGKVLEVKDVETYTYLRLQTKDGETWAAVAKTAVKKGAEVTIENVMIMNNFESKSLKKIFPTIIFGNLSPAEVSTASSGKNTAIAIAPSASVNGASIDIVARASGANAWTVAEIVLKSAELKDKPVIVRGRVVKYNPEIMAKNWIHLRDGSGSAANNNNDILVTTTSSAKVGEVLTVKGVVRTDKDFGAGYAYKVLIEDATIER